MNKAIISVIGKDKVGIIARVCSYLSESGINIEDISQTILQGFFTMMMVVDLHSATVSFDDVSAKLGEIGDELGVVIKIQHEDIFSAMHRI
ncbi:MAG: ACT domain-containing protein [Christensenellaceae bacterium]|nr:ACT domain-containing protein [Christensenellaceae bacterium]